MHGCWLIPGCQEIGHRTENNILHCHLYDVKGTEPLALYLLDNNETVELVYPEVQQALPLFLILFCTNDDTAGHGRMASHLQITTATITTGTKRAASPELTGAM